MDSLLSCYVSLAGCVLIIWLLKRIKSSATTGEKGSVSLNKLPSPPSLPFLGHLHLLRGDPFVDMTTIAEEYGDIYSLQLGTVPAVVVSSLPLMKEILVGKSSSFGHRPNFLRYNVLFGGDKENSLAFCDWSETQKLRRALARKFCHTLVFGNKVESSIERGGEWLTDRIAENSLDGSVARTLKQDIQIACANIFFEFFSSQSFDREENLEFSQIIRYFDDIFWDINQNHPTDVLPFLSIFYQRYLANMSAMSKSIRNFVLRHVIPYHLETLDEDNPRDLVDNLLLHLRNESDSDENKLTMEQVLFELEDFLGGHSAVGNLIARALVEIAGVTGLSTKIYEEVVEKQNSAYLQAVLYETLRKTSSPIVPHVASVDTSISGYEIKKGTMVIFNNFELNLGARYWSEPEKFMPERFLTDEGAFRKPSHFLPFSTGKRSCMGYKLVENVFEGILTSIVKSYDLETTSNPTVLPISCVALHPDVLLGIHFTPRQLN